MTFFLLSYSYTGAVASSTSSKKALLPDLKTDAEEALVRKLSNCYEILADGVQDLKEQLTKTEKEKDLKRSAFLSRNLLIPSLEHLGTAASEAEALIPKICFHTHLTTNYYFHYKKGALS